MRGRFYGASSAIGVGNPHSSLGSALSAQSSCGRNSHAIFYMPTRLTQALWAARGWVDGAFRLEVICVVIFLAIKQTIQKHTFINIWTKTRQRSEQYMDRPFLSGAMRQVQSPSKQNRWQNDECIQALVTNVSDIFLE